MGFELRLFGFGFTLLRNRSRRWFRPLFGTAIKSDLESTLYADTGRWELFIGWETGRGAFRATVGV